MASSLPNTLWLIFLLLPFCVIGQSSNEISLGSSLSTLDKNPSWVSPSGEFAFGFRLLPGRNNSLLAIWFNKIPEKTTIWSANEGNPVESGSKVEITKDGLLLYNHQGQEIWNRKVVGMATKAAMLDTGNFVLKNGESVSVWESFDEPTDTILPRQVLGLGTNLSARLLENDYSKGRFELRISKDGQARLYSVSAKRDSNYGNVYWASRTVGSEFVFNETTSHIYQNQTNGSLFYLTQPYFVSTEDFYHRATLDFDGIFRQYVYPKSGTSKRRWPQSWSVMWSTPPGEFCIDESRFVGRGICGYNSYCKLGDDQRPHCACPPGYSFLYPNDEFGGCKQNVEVNYCELNRSIPDPMFDLLELTNIDWPFADYELYEPFDEDGCRRVCLDDCLCEVAIYRGQSCWKKRLPLLNGKMDPAVRGKALIKVMKDNSSFLPSPNSCGKKKDRTALIIIGSSLLGSSVFLNFLLLLAICLAFLYSYRIKLLQHHQTSSMVGINLRSFTFRELEEVTNGFKEELGRGAFGTVYKGVSAFASKNFVAVKKLDKLVQESEKEFKAEVSTIGQTHHKNLVRLIGFCSEGSQRLLVYDYMSNGSLASFLFRSSKPNWDQRLQIVFGIARGLLYLHEECHTQIIHCDIKPENVLIDDSFTAKISDFGLAKLLQMDQTHAVTGIRGTKGYVAPEWFRNVPVTAKIDVYSFGVMILEIICCRKNVELEARVEERVILTDWAYDCYVEGRLDMLVENDAEAMNDMKKVERLVMVAIWCIQEDPSLRPSMKKVTEMLEGIANVYVPPNPSSFSTFG